METYIHRNLDMALIQIMSTSMQELRVRHQVSEQEYREFDTLVKQVRKVLKPADRPRRPRRHSGVARLPARENCAESCL